MLRNIGWTVVSLVSSVIAFTVLFVMLFTVGIDVLLGLALVAFGVGLGAVSLGNLIIIDRVMGEERDRISREA